jgi:hypothetical protein
MLSDLLGATPVAALGALFSIMAWQGWRMRIAMRQWPTAPALIRGYRERFSLRRSTWVDVEVRYRYQGRDYTAWCASPTGTAYAGDMRQARRQVARIFPIASTHDVYVNPTRADEAFLMLPASARFLSLPRRTSSCSS